VEKNKVRSIIETLAENLSFLPAKSVLKDLSFKKYQEFTFDCAMAVRPTVAKTGRKYGPAYTT
jgi:hypothetical protein